MQGGARVVIGLLVLALVVSVVVNAQTREQLETSRARVAALEDALEEANDSIESQNAQITDAQGLAGSSYEEISEALESLEEGATVDVPD